MQTCPIPHRFTRYIRIMLLVTVFLSGVLPASLVHADDGDFVWVKTMGADEIDRGYSIAVDTSGNIYTTGSFKGTVDFDPGPGTSNLTNTGAANAVFISKLDSNGDFVWAKSISGNNCIGHSITVDDSGNVYTTGFFWYTIDFDPGPEIFNLESEGCSDIFICKLDSDGNFIWAKAMGGTQYDNAYGLSVDTSGNVYTTGLFQSTVDFDPGPETYNLINASGYDVFVSKLDTNGDFVWAKAMEGSFASEGRDLTIDLSGNVYTTGYFQGAVDFDPGDMTEEILTSTGYSQDIFVSKLDTNGDFVWAKAMGGTSLDNGYGISVDTSGNVYTTGFFKGTADFDPGETTSEILISIEDTQDIFVSKLDTSGDFVWAKAMGGPQYEYGKGIAVDTSGNTHITGYFNGTVDFDPGPGTFDLTSTDDSEDIFIVRLDAPPDSFPWSLFLPAITNKNVNQGDR